MIIPSSLFAEDVTKNVVIDADTISYDREKKSAEAIGNVVLNRGVGVDAIQLTCHTLKAFFDEKGDFLRAVSHGEVKITKGEVNLESTTCTYCQDTQKVEAFGGILLRFKQHILWGDVLKGDLSKGFYTVTAPNKANQLVKAHIYVKSKSND